MMYSMKKYFLPGIIIISVVVTLFLSLRDWESQLYSLVNNKKGNIHECYINNKKCYADEAKFGGIVIQIVE